jgi:CRISPR-associated endonuclease Csn1
MSDVNMSDHVEREFILGIDLGTNSVGWAMVGWRDGGPAEIVRAGSRVFDAGMDVDNKSGKESSRNLARRTARLIRRQHWRRGRRLKRVFHLLKSYGLFPDRKVSGPEDRQDFLNELDRAILASPWFSVRRNLGSVVEAQHVMPYILRAAALDEALEPFFMGRALYHLAQRRGFLSNRKERHAASKEKEEDEGKVKSGIAELRKNMEESGARTLGEHFSRLAPTEARIRGRWTARSMYEDEFERIWYAQARFHADLLTTERKKELRSAIFFQRPLKVRKNLIGKCEVESEERRAPKYLLLSQRFRLLQRVNDLRALSSDGTERRLTPDERTKLLETLEREGDQTFGAIRKLLGLKTTHFNLEEGGETKLPGNRTASQLYSVFGERWLGMSVEERDQVVEYIHGFQRADKLRGAAASKWQLDDASAEKFAGVTLESDYFNLSRRAMEKLLPSLEENASYADARLNAYGEPAEHKLCDLLPPVDRWREIRNPGVTRSLTELRKVVNAIVRQYGKPAEIRIELARDLRQTKAQREKAWKKNRENQREREKAKKKILEKVGLAQPSNEDIRKVLLFEECNFTCPYTGKSISMSALVGHESQFDIEHIIPFSRSLDDSFANLTLCYHEENRNVKRNQTPGEAYASNPERFQEILGRVERFRSDFKREKLRRFQMTTAEVEEAMNDFTSRQLNDTRYATKLAGDYLALLYGGRVDAEGRRRIRATAGQVTAFLRNEWKLNVILRDGPTANGGAVPKSREDHRHHAIDAVVTALTDDGTIQALSRAAERAPAERRRRFGVLEGPWPNFVDSVRARIETMVVSHRPQKKVSGALHKETNYSADQDGFRHHRVSLTDLSEKDVMDDGVIVDGAIRKCVRERLVALGGGDPAKLFALASNVPYMTARDGRKIPIRKVRIKETVKTRALGQGSTTRYVRTGSNHHVEVFAEIGPNGSEMKWDSPGVITMLEACERLKKRQPVVQRQLDPPCELWEFRFSVATGEVLDCYTGPDKRELLVVRSISQEEKTGSIKINLVRVTDARKKNEIIRSKSWITKSPNELRKMKARKVIVSPLGDVSESHD